MGRRNVRHGIQVPSRPTVRLRVEIALSCGDNFSWKFLVFCLLQKNYERLSVYNIIYIYNIIQFNYMIHFWNLACYVRMQKKTRFYRNFLDPFARLHQLTLPGRDPPLHWYHEAESVRDRMPKWNPTKAIEPQTARRCLVVDLFFLYICQVNNCTKISIVAFFFIWEPDEWKDSSKSILRLG